MFAWFALSHAAPLVLSDEATRIHAEVRAFEGASCEPALQGVFDRLRPLTPDDVDLDDARSRGAATIAELFEARRALQERLGELHARGELTPGCVRGARRFDLATRYLADHLALVADGATPWIGATGPEDLRAGDVLVTRGDGLSSSGIAHIGRIDSHFSHNAMVHVDEAGRLWTVEAYLEKGALVQPLDAFLNHGLGRIVVARYEDAELAARGAAMAFARITEGAPIDYDAGFDAGSAETLFCSEIAPWALRLAGGPADVPLHQTHFPRDENPRLFDALGIAVEHFPAPADLLFDPRFEIVGEWRSIEHLEAMRRQDKVSESLFTWMERDGYALNPRWAHRATVDVGLAVRRAPGVGDLLADRIHPRAERQFLVAGLALQQAGEAVLAELNTRLDGREPLTWDALGDEIEAVRAADRARWDDRPRKARLHRVLAPDV